MDATELAKTGLVGWRETVAASVAGPVSERTPLADEQVRAVMGGVFFALTVSYVVGTLRRPLTAARS
jgi:hypothetical protein